jgi:hypothetical protein
MLRNHKPGALPPATDVDAFQANFWRARVQEILIAPMDVAGLFRCGEGGSFFGD